MFFAILEIESYHLPNVPIFHAWLFLPDGNRYFALRFAIFFGEYCDHSVADALISCSEEACINLNFYFDKYSDRYFLRTHKTSFFLSSCDPIFVLDSNLFPILQEHNYLTPDLFESCYLGEDGVLLLVHELRLACSNHIEHYVLVRGKLSNDDVQSVLLLYFCLLSLIKKY